MGKFAKPGKMRLEYFVVFCTVILTSCVTGEVKETKDESAPNVDEENLTYAKGSLCGYCDYCKVSTSLIIAHVPHSCVDFETIN